MAYHKTIFRQMLQFFSRLDFQAIVNRHRGDYRSRTLRCWDQFICLLFAQLSSRHSLRDTIAGLSSFERKLYHLGCATIHRSTLSDANNKRPYKIYEDVYFFLLARIQKIAPRHKLKLNRKLYFMDSTTIDLCLKLFPWARFRTTKAAIKIHTLLQADGTLPVFVTITDGKVHDVTAARQLKIPKGSFVVFDRGYHDFKLYNSYDDNGIRFVTRAKTNAKYEVLKSLPVDSSNGVLSDEIIQFTGCYTRKKYPKTLRRICYFDAESNKEYVFLTNDFDLEAKVIADIYKARWEIEIFFKTIKQNLKIKRFMGTSANAVMTQVWIALIAYLLVSFQKFMHKSKLSIQAIFRLIQINLMERKSIEALVKQKQSRPHHRSKPAQMALFKV